MSELLPLTYLTRLSITGPIHNQTPLCVLLEIADAHGIKYNPNDRSKPDFPQYIIDTIKSTDVPLINEVPVRDDWRSIARFINKSAQWPQSKLAQAYNYISQFFNITDPLAYITKNYTIGLQTPSNPTSINACVLYRICVHHHIRIDYQTTLEQMDFAVRMLSETSESLLRRAKIFMEKEAKRIDLINILLLSPNEIKDIEDTTELPSVPYVITPKCDMTHEFLTSLHSALHDQVELRSRIDPSTPGGAIALAAINYNVDISKSSVPIREYKILKISQRDGYSPVDKWMQYWYARNPSIFDLTCTFNPLFPEIYYDKNRILEMVVNAGYTYTESQREHPYELLQLAYVGETFYQGEMPGLVTTETPVSLEEVDDIQQGLLLCYGTRTGQMNPITINELIETFTVNQNFSSPFRHNAVFSTTSINKLKRILQEPCDSQSALRQRFRLLEVIAELDIVLRNTDEPTRYFAQAYRNADQDTKASIRSSLQNLLHTGMYMRGWDGKSVYPTVNANVPTSRDGEVAFNVTRSISTYESQCRSLGRIGTQLNDLPLVSYKSGEYLVSTSANDGFTIGQRLDIVKQGETTNNISSCIRLSSNWICASAHKYITSLGLPAPFDIFNLRRIS